MAKERLQKEGKASVLCGSWEDAGAVEAWQR